MPGYSDAFKSSLPPTMSHYVKPEYMNFELTDLLKECERVFTSYLVNTYTKQQSRSGLWFHHRAGRFTASK